MLVVYTLPSRFQSHNNGTYITDKIVSNKRVRHGVKIVVWAISKWQMINLSSRIHLEAIDSHTNVT